MFRALSARVFAFAALLIVALFVGSCQHLPTPTNYVMGHEHGSRGFGQYLHRRYGNSLSWHQGNYSGNQCGTATGYMPNAGNGAHPGTGGAGNGGIPSNVGNGAGCVGAGSGGGSSSFQTPTEVNNTVCQNGTATATTFACTFPAPAVGDYELISISGYSSSGCEVTSVTNATIIDVSSSGTSGSLCVASAYFVAASSPPTSITVNGATATHWGIQVTEFTGIASIAAHASSGLPSYQTSCSPAQVTPTQSGSLVWMYMGNSSDSGTTPDGSVTSIPALQDSQQFNAKNTYGILDDANFAIEATSAVPVTGTWSFTASQTSGCGIVVITPASISTPTPSPSPSPTPTPTPVPTPTRVAETVCQNGSSTNTTYTCSLSPTPTTGDLLLINVAGYASGGGTITSIPSTTIIDSNTSNSRLYGAAWEAVGGTPPTSVTVNTSIASHLVVTVTEVANVNTTTPIDQHGTAANSTTTCTVTKTPSQVDDVAWLWNSNSSDNEYGSASTSPTLSPTITTYNNKVTYGIEGSNAWGVDTGSAALTGTWTWSTTQAANCGEVLVAPLAGAGAATPTPSPSPTPSPTPTADTAVMAHVMTYDRCCGGYESDMPSGGVDAALPWVTYWGQPSANGCDASGSVPTCASYPEYGLPGLDTKVSSQYIQSYIDPNVAYPADGDWTNFCNTGTTAATCVSGGEWWTNVATTCTNAVVEHTEDGIGIIKSPYSSGIGSVWGTEIASKDYNVAPYYGIVFLDDFGAYDAGDSPSTPCYNSAAWAEPATSEQVASIFNTLTVSGRVVAPVYWLNALLNVALYGDASDANNANLNALASPASVTGFECENCYTEGGSPTLDGVQYGWAKFENEAIQLNDLGKLNQWMNDTNDTGSTSYSDRMYAYASIMLTWNPAYTIIQSQQYGYPSCATTTPPTPCSTQQIHVFPEVELTMYNPRVGNATATQSVNIYEDHGNANVYVREYQNCYLSQVPIGNCAVVINPQQSTTEAAPTDLVGTYTHTMAITSQNDVLDSGTISLTGSAMPGTLPAVSGYVLTP